MIASSRVLWTETRAIWPWASGAYTRTSSHQRKPFHSPDCLLSAFVEALIYESYGERLIIEQAVYRWVVEAGVKERRRDLAEAEHFKGGELAAYVLL